MKWLKRLFGPGAYDQGFKEGYKEGQDWGHEHGACEHTHPFDVSPRPAKMFDHGGKQHAW